ncbi:MAG: bifunctional glyoxylate/hydroxypyruvate reductase [Pseudomonas orientalis]|jgi:phosphogluconate 2-dehydrogenase|nr:bifunctional glyoxylate/hydroxypyruvate reductase [Pseudomonas orientalis]
MSGANVVNIKPNLLVFSRVSSEQVLAELDSLYNVTYCIDPLGADQERFFAALPEADALLGASLKLDRALLARAPRLKVIASVSAGYDNYDLDYLRERGIRLTNTPDAVTETTADTAFLLLMMAARRALELADLVRQGHWREKNIADSLFGTDVHGKRLGIIGLGRIGAAIARRGHFGFGMSILYSGQSNKPALEQELGAQRMALEQLLDEADFICVCVPLSDATRQLIGAREFALMGEQSIFLNVSRGPVVDETALIEVLQRRGIRAAALDVFAQEPLPADSPLLGLNNMLALPHIGSATREARALMARTAAANLKCALEGHMPPDCVV